MCFKNFMNLILTLGFLTGLSFGSYQFCNWYGCNNCLSFMRADLIYNACTDANYHLKNYHLKNYQTYIYGSIFTLITYQFTTLINKASSKSDTYIFEDYSLGKKSPRSLKKV